MPSSCVGEDDRLGSLVLSGEAPASTSLGMDSTSDYNSASGHCNVCEVVVHSAPFRKRPSESDNRPRLKTATDAVKVVRLQPNANTLVLSAVSVSDCHCYKYLELHSYKESCSRTALRFFLTSPARQLPFAFRDKGHSVVDKEQRSQPYETAKTR